MKYPDIKTINKQVADSIKRVREQYGTQQEFADTFNVFKPIELQTSRGNISKYELGINVPRANVYIKILNMQSK